MATVRKVDVVVPEIKLTVTDLAYLASLESGIRCHAKDSVRNKLKFLGLIVYGDIPPCPKAIAKYEEEGPKLRAEAEAAIISGKWDALHNAASRLRFRTKPSATKDYSITKYGKEILQRGRTKTVTAAKGGCL